MIAGASIKCLPYAAFFGYFLGGARKYRPRQGTAIHALYAGTAGQFFIYIV